MKTDPLIHVPLYLDEWQSKLSGYDYFKRGAFITLFIKYIKSNGELEVNGDNTALFRSCGAINSDEQESLLEIYKEVKEFADPKIERQTQIRDTRRSNASKGGLAKAKANGLANAKNLAEQKPSKSSSKRPAKLELESELELELKSESELKENALLDSFEKVWTLYEKKGNRKTSLSKWCKLPEKTKALIFEKLPAYIKSTPDKQFRKDFQSYIEKECWNDEIVVKGGQNGLPFNNHENYKDELEEACERRRKNNV